MSSNPPPCIAISLISEVPGLGLPSHAAVLVVQERLNPVMRASNFFANAEFSWIQLAIVFAERSDPGPQYVGRSKKHGDIAFRTVVSGPAMLRCTAEDVHDVLTVLATDVVIHVGRRYGLPFEEVAALRARHVNDEVLRVLGAGHHTADALLSQIAPSFADAANALDLRVDSEQRAEGFGNALIQMTGPRFDLRIARDRGDVLVDVSPAGHCEWHRLEAVLEFVLERPQPADPVALASALSANVATVAALMAADASRAGLLAFERERGEILRRELFPPP